MPDLKGGFFVVEILLGNLWILIITDVFSVKSFKILMYFSTYYTKWELCCRKRHHHGSGFGTLFTHSVPNYLQQLPFDRVEI